MAEYQKVKSSREISVEITDFLEMFVRRRTNGLTRGKNIREINDILQGRSKRTVDELLNEVREESHNWYPAMVEEFRREIDALQAQKALLAVPYDKTGGDKYYFETYTGEGRPLKIIDQALFDRAAKIDGFPPDFFRESYFDHVTIYCMPDDADCSGSSFRTCTFAACRIKGTLFSRCAIYDAYFHSCLLDNACFQSSMLAFSHFMDCTLTQTRFADSTLKRCGFWDDVMEDVSFHRSIMDGADFTRIKAKGIRDLNTVSITHSGATAEEVEERRHSIYKALKVPEHDTRPRRHRQSGPER